MQYVGSKGRLSKELAPIIQSYITPETKGYLEPFVGGANMIDKIKHHNKIGYDIHEELIELLKYSQKNELPETVSEDVYNLVRLNKNDYDKWYVGLVGFCGSFGAKYFGGFARRYNNDGSLFDVPKQAINSLRKQSKKDGWSDIVFKNKSFVEVDDVENHVIYCDIPYRNTTKYATEIFPYDKFYDWCVKMSQSNTILVSEYWMPDSSYDNGKYSNLFQCVWEKEHITSLGSGVNNYKGDDNKKIEKLFVVKCQ